MFFYMIEKELKHFFRNMGNILLMFLFPILLITILGFSLDGLMNGAGSPFTDCIILYSQEGDSVYAEGFNSFKETFSKEFKELTFKEATTNATAKELVNSNKATAYLTINDTGYEYYRNPTGESNQSKLFRSIFEGFSDKYSLLDITAKTNPTLVNSIFEEEVTNYISDIPLGTNEVSAMDYYTFAELALILLYLSIIVGESVVNESSLSTLDRFSLSNVSTTKFLFSKITVGVIIGFIQILVVYIYSTFVLGTNWGSRLPLMFLTLLALAIFASILGGVIGLLLKDGKNLNSTLNVFIILLCLLGGCYMPLSMIKGLPIIGDLTVISPIYWVNSALISLGSGLNDNFPTIAIIICLTLSILLVFLYFIINRFSRRKA